MEEALRRFDEALRLDANYVGALINRGRALAALGRVEEASAALARVVQLQPGSAAAHAFRGSCCVRWGVRPRRGRIWKRRRGCRRQQRERDRVGQGRGAEQRAARRPSYG